MAGSTIITGGLYPPSGVGLVTELLDRAGPSEDVFAEALLSLEETEESLGDLTAEPSPFGTGVVLTVTPDFPADYGGIWVVLRGRYEYKENTQDPQTVVVAWGLGLDEATSEDTDLAENTHYYYSLLALCGGPSFGPYHWRYRRDQHRTAYRTASYDTAGAAQRRLPAPWGQEPGFLEELLAILGRGWDNVRADQDTWLRRTNSTQDSQLAHLGSLASIVGWRLDPRMRGSRQRKELAAVPLILDSKGTDRSLDYLVQQATGWAVEFEQGRRRLLRNGIAPGAYRASDARRQALRGVPERRRTAVSLGMTTGLTGQVFTITDDYPRDFGLLIGSDSWLVAADTTSLTNTLQLTGTAEARTLTVGTASNGGVPEAGLEVFADYYYGGDEYLYAPSPSGWRSPTGLRLLLTEMEGSPPLTEATLGRTTELIRRYGAAYLNIEVLLLPVFVVESAPAADDWYEDEITSYLPLISNKQDHASNKQGYVVAFQAG